MQSDPAAKSKEASRANCSMMLTMQITIYVILKIRLQKSQIHEEDFPMGQ
jgi:hypothetical protein